jgi:hypothetical protein
MPNEKARREAHKQQQLSHAMCNAVTDTGKDLARAAIESVIKHGEPQTPDEDLVISALYVAAKDDRVRAAINNAAQVFEYEAELAKPFFAGKG